MSPASSAFLKLASVLFLTAAVAHLWQVLSPDSGDTSSPLRHCIFVGINLLVAVGLQRRPPWLRYVFAILVVQQINGHGGIAWRLWREHGELDLVSILIVILLPAVWLVLWREHDTTR